jgi:hypothetical protein
MAKFRAGEECNPILASVPPYAGRSRPSQWWPQTRPALTAPARGGFEIGGRDGRMSSRAAEQKNGPVGCAASAPPGKYSRPTSPRPPLPQARRRHAVEMALDPIIINRDDIAQWTRCSLGYGGSPLADLVAFSHLQFSQIRGPPALPICAKDSVRHRPRFAGRSPIQLVKPRTTPQKAEPSAFAKDFFYSLNERVSCLIDPRWLDGLGGNCGHRLRRPCRSHIGCCVNIRWARTAWIEITIHS